MTDSNPFGGGVIRREMAPTDGEAVKAGLLIIPPVVPAPELQLHCLARREDARDFPGANEVIFEDDDGEPDTWDVVSRDPFTRRSEPGAKSQAAKWQAIMSWPYPPSRQEAEAWQANANAEAANALTDRITAARAIWNEAEELAAHGDDVFWRSWLPSLPATGQISDYDVAFELMTQTSSSVWPALRKQAIANAEAIEARRAAKRQRVTVDPSYDPSI